MTLDLMKLDLKPIGFVQTGAETIPRHWSVSDVEGIVTIEPEYIGGIRDIIAGQRIVVIFYFHKSPPFTPRHLFQTPPHRKESLGVFSICSPVRPNPIGMSVLEVLEVNGGQIWVKGLDMLDGTPLLDIKPYIEKRTDCPSWEERKTE